MTLPPQAYYQKALTALQNQYQLLNRRYNRVSTLRGIVFLLGVALAYFLFQWNFGAGMLASIAALFGFLYLIKHHTEISDQRSHLQRLVEVHERELRALAHDFQDFDEGKDFVDPDHAYSYDLDIFGRASLFQFLNRSGSLDGRTRLARYLQTPPLSAVLIQSLQAAIQDLGRTPDWLLRFEAIGRGTEESGQERKQLQAWLSEPWHFTNSRLYPVLLRLLPTLFFGALAFWLIPDLPPLQAALGALQAPGWVPGLLFLLNLGVVGRHLKLTAKQQLQVGKQSRVLKAYARLLGEMEDRSSEADYLRKEQEALKVSGEPASAVIHHLGELAGLLDQRLNIVVGLFLNGMLLWDLRYMLKLEKWRRQNGPKLLPWLDLIAEWDALASLGRYAYNHPDYLYPSLGEGEFHLVATELGHPLLRAATRVCNDMALHKSGEFLIVTGANMAGKSTFLRTVGTNLILAHCGAPVCARTYSFVPIPMITSIRAHDSLEDNESYFYAELKQLKKIIDKLDEGPAFVIVDEMLRGTNSHDKQTGSRKFIEQLIQKKGVGMIATHDLALGELAEAYPDYAFNKRFEVDITDGHLTFDYKLQDGVSQNLNATFLMEQMGIMPRENKTSASGTKS